MKRILAIGMLAAFTWNCGGNDSKEEDAKKAEDVKVKLCSLELNNALKEIQADIKVNRKKPSATASNNDNPVAALPGSGSAPRDDDKVKGLPGSGSAPSDDDLVKRIAEFDEKFKSETDCITDHETKYVHEVAIKDLRREFDASSAN